MEPIEWERLADDAAARLESEISALEAEISSGAARRSFKHFWDRLRALEHEIQAAPAIKLDDKLRLQHRLGELSRHVRREQKQVKQSVAERRAQLLDGIALARESLAESSTVQHIQEVRQDLNELRARIGSDDTPFRPEERQEIWQAWQEANQVSWQRLNEEWKRNEEYLAAHLDKAQNYISQGEPRLARELIKAFHNDVAQRECSHASLRALRVRASTLWHEADDLRRQRHEAYLAQLSQRVAQWQRLRERHARERAQLCAEIRELEQRASSVTTDVGAAMTRGQLNQRRRALADIESADQHLAQRINEAELALQRS